MSHVTISANFIFGSILQTLGTLPTISIQKTDGCQVYLSNDSLNAEIVTSKSSEMNVLAPIGDDGDFVSYFIKAGTLLRIRRTYNSCCYAIKTFRLHDSTFHQRLIKKVSGRISDSGAIQDHAVRKNQKTHHRCFRYCLKDYIALIKRKLFHLVCVAFGLIALLNRISTPQVCQADKIGSI